MVKVSLHSSQTDPKTSGKHEFDSFGYELCVSQEEPSISDNALPQVRETSIFKTLTVFNNVAHCLVGLFTAAPWEAASPTSSPRASASLKAKQTAGIFSREGHVQKAMA
jgi:hypothetical protein